MAQADLVNLYNDPNSPINDAPETYCNVGWCAEKAKYHVHCSTYNECLCEQHIRELEEGDGFEPGELIKRSTKL